VAQDLCETGLQRAGEPGNVKFCASKNRDAINAHFRWLQEAGIDGAAVQRFMSTLRVPAKWGTDQDFKGAATGLRRQH